MTSVVAMASVARVEGKPNLLIGAYDIASVGYTASEYFVSATARAYGEGQHPEADFTTRIVALLPTDTAKFNGTVLVEWLNVSGGIDAPAVWFMAHREMIREGYGYVAVSAQKVGVDGGATITGFDMSLKTQDPERYSRLSHPGDAYSFDMFSQVGRLVRASPDEVLGRLTPEHVIAIGESQSAMFLTTYINAVDQHAGVFDGFLVHSRFGGAAPLGGINTLESFEKGEPDPSPFRDDLRVPVMNVITETDIVGAILPGYYMARQQDNHMLRTWEIAGTAHADAYTVKVGFIDDGSVPIDKLAAGYAPRTELMGQQLKQPFNFGPQHHYVLQAAIARLHAWVRAGEAPPHAPRLETDDDAPPAFVVDEHGIAKGGLRTPWVEVPIARTSGTGDAATPVALLFGSGEPFDDNTRNRLYPGGKTEYVRRFTEELDATIRAGYLLRADRSEILELAAATY
jgi:alpha/beta hydrolase family protein